MIVKNRIIVGYGDVAIGVRECNLVFETTKFEQEVGLDVTNFNYETIGDEIIIPITHEEAIELKSKILGSNYFEFKGYIFDFMKKDCEASKDVFMEAIDGIMLNNIILMND